MQKKKWTIRNHCADSETISAVSKEYGIPPLVASILLKREVENIEEFLDPKTDRLHDPFLMQDMDAAVNRIIKAIDQGEKITVYGDYDVDGITSTASLVNFLRKRGAETSYYIPDRLQEGYGINCGAIDEIAESGASLLITVDCGITAVEETKYAKSIGIDIIVTDHHECKEILPDCVAVLNPKRPDCDYPFKKLAGVGVVFKLLQALALRLKMHMKELFEEYIDVVALGTVADVMTLTGENRIIVKNGIEQLRYTENKGLKALIKQAAINPEHINTGTIGFALAPRINAAGRVGDPKLAVELLLSEEDTFAEKEAYVLDQENHDRQQTEQKIYEDVLSMLENDPSYREDSVLILANHNWHHGIIGIVASKITERYHKPCILISLDQELGKGSGRSIKHFNLFTALSECSDILVKFGGHELAAGLTLERNKIDIFRRQINEYAKQTLRAEDFIPEVLIDSELPIAYANLNTIEKMSVLAPYGMGNPNPVFMCKNLMVTSIRTMSEGKHLRLSLSDGICSAYAVGFSMGELFESLKVGQRVDIVFHLELNIYRGERRAQILLKDIRLV